MYGKHCEDANFGERSPPAAAGRERRNLAAPSSQPGKLNTETRGWSEAASPAHSPEPGRLQVRRPSLCNWRAQCGLCRPAGWGSDPARPSVIITVTSLAACLGAGCRLRGASRNLRGNLVEQNLVFVMFQSRKRRPREGK